MIKHRRVIATNNAYQLGPWVDFCFFGDCRWWDWHRKALATYAGITVTCCPRLKDNGTKYLRCMERGKPVGIDSAPGKISWGRHTGASVINFAYHLGANPIVLLGYDMRRVDDKPNWHDQHPCPDKNPYDRFLKSFPPIRRDAEALGLKIINCTPNSALTIFPMMSLEDFLKQENQPQPATAS